MEALLTAYLVGYFLFLGILSKLYIAALKEKVDQISEERWWLINKFLFGFLIWFSFTAIFLLWAGLSWVGVGHYLVNPQSTVYED